MIRSREELNCYLEADKFALGINHRFPLGPKDDIWRFERTLRFYEYHKNVGNKLLRLFFGYLLAKRGKRLGFSISANCFGPGLRINHSGLLIINAKARIGKWCDVHQGVNIGENGYIDENGTIVSTVPVVGDYCFIGPGAKIFGSAQIGDNVRIGANAVVNNDVPSGMVVVGYMKVLQPSKNNLSIANENTELQFLHRFPQYKEIMSSL